jgi:MHS family proline/betaine transporter-like MFS transporter
MVAATPHSRTQAEGAKVAITAAVIGNVLEWYDFAVYGFMAGLIGKNFFPAGDEVTQLLAAFAVFGVGFLARPLGGIVIGRIGDVKGRKTALLITIFLMASGTVLIGIVPTYATIGIAGPILILLARLMQGFSAGGEWGGSTAFIVEWASESKRGFIGSFQQCSVSAGLLLGSGVAALVTTIATPATMESWGWRIPFLIGGLLGPVGMYMRRNIDETPAYKKAMAAPASLASGSEAKPLWLAVQAFGFTVLWTVAFYIFLAYMPTFTRAYLKLSSAQALWSNTIGLFVLLVAIPPMGLLSDRVGRKPLLLACCAAFIVLPYPVFSWLLTGVSFGMVILVQIAVGLIISLFSGPGPAAISEIFPTKTRSTWMSTGYALSVAIFGGFAPYIATWLIKATGSPISPFYYVMAAAAVTTTVIAGLKETAHEPLG